MSQLFASGGQSIGVVSFSISPSNEHSGLVSFRMDWLDLLAVQGTLKSLLQHYSSKVSLLWCLSWRLLYNHWLMAISTIVQGNLTTSIKHFSRYRHHGQSEQAHGWRHSPASSFLGEPLCQGALQKHNTLLDRPAVISKTLFIVEELYWLTASMPEFLLFFNLPQVVIK